MADRKVRAIFEAKVDGAKKNIVGFAKDVSDAGKKVDGLVGDLKDLDGLKASPDIDVEIDAAKKKLNDLTGELADLKAEEPSLEVDFKIEQTKAAIKDVRKLVKDLTSEKAEVKVDVAIKDAQKRISDLTKELGDLRTQDARPEVDVEIKAAQKKLRDAKSELRELSGAKAEMKVTADTSDAESALSGISNTAADAGTEAGDEAGGNIVEGITGAIAAIPVAGAIIGAGVVIAGGLIQGIKDGLKIEAGRDLFSARTGLDEDSSARFGRAAGEAYANAWGTSVEDNLETARVAMEQGLIAADATDREVEKVIASLSGVTDIMQEDIPTAARAAGQLIKTGLVDDAQGAFDVLVAGYQNGANASEDFLDTLIEYPTHFRDLGLSAEDATGLLIQGMEGGAFNADKVADSLKELTIRVKENGEESSAALETLGLSGTAMADAFAEGGPKARDALDQILSRLSAVKDPADRSRLAVALFGTQAEDMAAALGSLDLSKAAAEIGGVEGAAGAADRALATMSDNSSAKIESAKRNIETAMDGIKGALAEAFGDEIGGVSDWISQNRAPLMQFFLDVINGAFDMGVSFAEFGATALDALADVIDSMADVMVWMPGFSITDKQKMQEDADSIRNVATTIRTEVPAALNETRDAANEWAAPEILKAKVHDATAVMSADMDTFSAKVDKSGGTVKINGNKVNAEQALDVLVENINAEDGTVTINGNRVPAKDALSTLMREVNSSKGSVKVGGDTAGGRGSVARFMADTNGRSAKVSIGANTTSAEQTLSAFLGRPRSMTIGVRVAGVNGSVGGIPRHGGGIVKGLHGGGIVPGSDPGYDNVLWPLHSGGRTLSQPLTGGEMVVRAEQTAQWEPLLRAINDGLRPGDLRGGGGGQAVARLHPDDAALLAGVATRPVSLSVDGRTFASVTRRNQADRKGR